MMNSSHDLEIELIEEGPDSDSKFEGIQRRYEELSRKIDEVIHRRKSYLNKLKTQNG